MVGARGSDADRQRLGAAAQHCKQRRLRQGRAELMELGAGAGRTEIVGVLRIGRARGRSALAIVGTDDRDIGIGGCMHRAAHEHAGHQELSAETECRQRSAERAPHRHLVGTAGHLAPRTRPHLVVVELYHRLNRIIGGNLPA